LGKVEGPAKEEMQARALREWQRIEFVKRQAKLIVKSREIISVKTVLFEEEEDVVEEMGEKDKGNQQ